MSSPPTIAVAHYPEGAGHATRMLAVANALRERGATVEMAGGGAGTEFVALNGYEEFEPTTVDYVDTYQDGSIRRVLTESVPATAARVSEYVGWLRDVEPDALVTDDMFAAIAVTRTDSPLYVLKHDVPAMYEDRLERAGASFHTSFQISTARAFFYPTVWPCSDAEPAGVTPVPPVALAGDDPDHPAPEIIVVPSHYSDLGRIADQLERQGYDVLDVGADEWDPAASLLPVIRSADVVVCSGYSTVMDAAVAGTPCVVHPATDEQAAVADWLERFDVTGFTAASEPLDVLEAVASPPDPPAFENGANVIARAVLDGVAGDGRTAAPVRSSTEARSPNDTGPAVGEAPVTTDVAITNVRGACRRAADRLVAGATALGTAGRALALHGRVLTAGSRQLLSDGADSARRSSVLTWRALAARLGSGLAVVLGAGRATARRWRRYRIAAAAMAAATGVVASRGLRGTAVGLGVGCWNAGAWLRAAAGRGSGLLTRGVGRLVDATASATSRLAMLRERLGVSGRSVE